MRASDKSLADIFKKFDTDGSGELSNLEFKQAFRKLGIGLTSKDIDKLVNYCDESGEGIINYKEFVSKFSHNTIADRLYLRSEHRLQKLNDDLHYYMLSPKDAFR